MNQDQLILLMIGNSRLHWALCDEDQLIKIWHTPHLIEKINQDFIEKFFPQQLHFEELLQNKIKIKIASVVPDQLQFWQDYPHLKLIKLEDLPLKNLYPTIGIDRVLAIWGAVTQYSLPCLVIDGGTALTLTGINDQQELIGGAILPGLKMQYQTLGQNTANLPDLAVSYSLPPRWANNTPEAMKSGIIYTILGGLCDFIEDWDQQFPQSVIIFTGGDGQFLVSAIAQLHPELQPKISLDVNLIFYGMKNLKSPQIR
jgi:type III pantothenate kinase